MKKKLLGIFVSMLLIATSIPALSSIIKNNNYEEASAGYLNLVQQKINAGNIMISWPEKAKLIASDGAADDRFGDSVSIDGDYVIIGARFDDDNGQHSGSAYIFKRTGTTWTEEAKINASDGAAWDNFGISVSMDGDYAIIGAWVDDDNGLDSGSAYIFKRTGTTWTEEAKINASDGAAIDYFGESVSMDGDYAIIGAMQDDDNGESSGSAYIFKRTGTTWTEEAKINASDGAANSLFGNSVSIDGDYAIIGAVVDDDNGLDSGSAYIFKRTGTTWTEEAKINASDGATHEHFGCSVSMDGDYAIIGAMQDDDNGESSGSAYIFKRTGTTWTEEAKINASDGAAWDNFGRSVSMDGDYAIIGAAFDDDNGLDSGSAYIFKRTGTTWIEEDKLLASNGADDDVFGWTVSINGQNAIVGAPGDNNIKGTNAGSAYVFTKQIPDLKCDRSLIWTDVKKGETVLNYFTIENIGDPGSELSWEITEWPSWGSSWTFIPSSGAGLTPEMGTINVVVEVVAPDEAGEYTGEVKVVNIEDNNDFCTIPVSLTLEEDNTPPNVSITRPENGLYIGDNLIRPYLMRIPLIIGKITIEVEASDEDSGIEKVEFYINDDLIGTDTTPKYSYEWTRDRIRLFHLFSIKVVAYDNESNTAEDSMNVRKFL